MVTTECSEAGRKLSSCWGQNSIDCSNAGRILQACDPSQYPPDNPGPPGDPPPDPPADPPVLIPIPAPNTPPAEGYIPLYPVDNDHYAYIDATGTQRLVTVQPSTDNGFGPIPGGAVFPFAAPPNTAWIRTPDTGMGGFYHLIHAPPNHAGAA